MDQGGHRRCLCACALLYLILQREYGHHLHLLDTPLSTLRACPTYEWDRDSGHVRFEELVIPIYLPNLPRSALVILDHPNKASRPLAKTNEL